MRCSGQPAHRSVSPRPCPAGRTGAPATLPPHNIMLGCLLSEIPTLVTERGPVKHQTLARAKLATRSIKVESNRTVCGFVVSEGRLGKHRHSKSIICKQGSGCDGQSRVADRWRGSPRHAGEPQPDGGGLHHRQPRHPVGGVQGLAQPHLALQSKHDREACKQAGLGRLGTVGAEVDRGGGG